MYSKFYVIFKILNKLVPNIFIQDRIFLQSEDSIFDEVNINVVYHFNFYKRYLYIYILLMINLLPNFD